MDYQRADDGGYRIRFEVVEWYSLTLVAISRAKARKYRSSAVHPDVASLQKELLERFNNVSDDFREDGELRIGTRQLAALHEILQPSRIHRHYGRARRILLAQMRAYVASLMRGESPEPLNSAWVRKEEEAAAEQDWGWRGWQVNASTLTKREAYIASWVLKALRLRDVAVLNPRKSFVQIFDRDSASHISAALSDTNEVQLVASLDTFEPALMTPTQARAVLREWVGDDIDEFLRHSAPPEYLRDPD